MGNSLFMMIENFMRNKSCGELRASAISANVQLCGWVDRRRDHGGVIFIDLRDRSGTIQITVDPDQGQDLFSIAESLRNETVLQINGLVRARPDEAINTKIPTGEVEVLAKNIKILNTVTLVHFLSQCQFMMRRVLKKKSG